MKFVKCNLASNPKSVKVLKLLSSYNKPSEDWVALKPYISFRSKKRIKISRDYSLVAKQCFISHRFLAAATMLDVICQEFSMDNVFFYRATSVILEAVSHTTNEDFFHFMRHVIGLTDVNKREMILEYLIRCLKNQDLDGEHNVKVLMSRLRKNVSRNFIVDPLLKAYFGMYDYIEWAKGREAVGAEVSAEKAVEAFQEAIIVPGQWDIFVIKLVEILEAYKKLDESEQVLRQYLVVNPEHLNCHIYLSCFLRRYRGESPELVYHLKTIAKRSPSDSRVLMLVDLIKDNEPREAMIMLFMFLDYRCNAKNVDAWCALSDLLLWILENSVVAVIRTMNTYWKNRQDIWPYMHFNPKTIEPFDNEHAVRLAAMKGIVLSVFVKVHPFLQKLLELFSEDSCGHVPQETVQKHCQNFICKATHINFVKGKNLM